MPVGWGNALRAGQDDEITNGSIQTGEVIEDVDHEL